MKLGPLEILYHRKKIATQGERDEELVRKSGIIRAAEKTAFFTLLHEEIAVLHGDWLYKAEANPACGLAALSLVGLTNKLRWIKDEGDAILARRERQRRQEEEDAGKEIEQPLYVNSGESNPHII